MEVPKPSAIRNYLYEYVLIAFASAIIFLTYAVWDLNAFIREKLMQQISVSTEALHQSTEALRELKK